MYTIGLTGGIASGKSTVVSMLQKEYHAPVIDCDILAREVVVPGSAGLAAVVQAFGDRTLLPDGTMDRRYIGNLVFADKQRKAELEAILFPFIHQRIDEEIIRFRDIHKEKIIFLDMPLLFEVKYHLYVDETWLVYVDPKTQLTRLMQRNHFTEQEALNRIHAQFPIEEKRSLAQVIIDNTGSLEDTKRQVRVQWEQLLARVDNQ